MVGTNLKAETIALMEKRTALETEMDSIINRLSQPGGPGLTGNLVDSEGFPRSDIDIPAVRAERQHLAELKNDHKEITDRINASIEILHSLRHASKSSTPNNSGNSALSRDQGILAGVLPASVSSRNDGTSDVSGAMDVDFVDSRPFAMVDEITELSPAAEDGLQLGDQVVKFGSVGHGENLMQRLVSEAQSHQGRPIPVSVMRQGAAVSLSVTPRTWQGRGLLGCHFRML